MLNRPTFGGHISISQAPFVLNIQFSESDSDFLVTLHITTFSYLPYNILQYYSIASLSGRLLENDLPKKGYHVPLS